jgi:hypothetical protein
MSNNIARQRMTSYGTSATKIEAGKLPTYGSERLFAAEDVREGQFGYIKAGYRKLGSVPQLP